MYLSLTTLLLLLIQSTKHLYCFQNKDNVWETFETNSDFNENIPKFSESPQQLYETGKQRFQLMAREESIYGNCWRNAIQSLHTNCKQLNDQIQSRLALDFANCFLQRSGLKTYPCLPNEDIKLCLKDMSDRAFNSYTEFFTHTQSICFYLQSELWQQKTETTIDRLTQTSIKVKDRLEDASQQLDQLNGLQELSISSQKQVNEELKSATNSLNEFKSSSAEQRFIVKEILDRFIRLQDFVLLEISYGYSLLFFITGIIVVYFMTTPVRTNESRLWLFIVLIINLFVERLIASNSVDEQLLGLKSTSIVMNERIWLTRKISLTLMSVILFWFAFTYKNFNFVNYNILNEHTLRLNSIQNQLNQLLKTNQTLSNHQNGIKRMDITDAEYSSDDSDINFTDDSDYSTDESDATQASIDTCSTIPIVSSSTKSNSNFVKTENNENESNSLSVIPVISPKTYDLRPRKSIIYTKSGIFEESVEEFITRVKLSETVSKLNKQRVEQNCKNFLSSDED